MSADRYDLSHAEAVRLVREICGQVDADTLLRMWRREGSVAHCRDGRRVYYASGSAHTLATAYRDERLPASVLEELRNLRAAAAETSLLREEVAAAVARDRFLCDDCENVAADSLEAELLEILARTEQKGGAS